MIPATRAVGPARTAAAQLPWANELVPLYEKGVIFREGELWMIGGFPGSMKTTWATWLLNLWNLPTLYVQADTSAHDAITRLGALRSGMPHGEVSDAFAENGGLSAYVEEHLAESRIQFLFDDAPSLGDIEEELLAWVELYDSLPKILVVDNLIDLEYEDGGSDNWSAWNNALLYFKGICRTMGMNILVLHHARELTKSDWPAARGDFQGKPGKTPEKMLSVSLTPDLLFRVSPVKNRTGAQDAHARSGLEFQAHPETGTFTFQRAWNKDTEGDY